MYSIKEYETTIGEKLKDKDVAMLFLNAGIGPPACKFAEQDANIIEDCFMTNTAHPLNLARVLLPQMLKRD